MPAIKKTAKKDLSKKEARHKTETEMSKMFAHLKTVLGEKKFEHRIKKAAKVLMHGIDKEEKSEPQPAAAKKTAKAVAKKIK